MLIGLQFNEAELRRLRERVLQDTHWKRLRHVVHAYQLDQTRLADCRPGPPEPEPMKSEQMTGLAHGAAALALYHLVEPTASAGRTLRDFLLWTIDQEVLLHSGAYLQGQFLKGIVLVLDAVGESLTPAERGAVLEHLILTTVESPDQQALVNRHPAGHVPMRRVLDIPGSGFHLQEEQTNNWDILGAMGLLYVARATDALLPHRAADVESWNRVARRRAERFFRRQFTDEGEYGEGPGYYSYGTLGALLVLELLKRWPRGRWWQALPLGGLRASARWAREVSPRETIHGPFNFNDCSLGSYESPAVVAWIAGETSDAVAQGFGNELAELGLSRLENAACQSQLSVEMELESLLWSRLWRDPTLKAQGASGSRTSCFGRFGTAISRTGYSSHDLCLCFRCGDMAGAHTHADRGNFLLTAYGENLVSEGGKPQDRTIAEYQSYHRQSAAHNIARPTSGAQVLSVGEKPCSGRITQFEQLPNGLFLRADLSEVYPDAGKVERTLHFSHHGWLLIQDFIEQPGEAIEFLLHTDNRDRKTELRIEVGRAIIRRPNASLWVQPLLPADIHDDGTHFQDSDPEGLRSLVLRRVDQRMATLLIARRAGEKSTVRVDGINGREWCVTVGSYQELVRLDQTPLPTPVPRRLADA